MAYSAKNVNKYQLILNIGICIHSIDHIQFNTLLIFYSINRSRV